MIDTNKYEEFENAMNEGRIERVHCLWALAEVKRLREGIEHALHIRLKHGQEEGWKELKEMIE